MQWFIYYSIRVIATLACMFTFYNVAINSGHYTISKDALVIGTISFVLMIRLWSPPCENKKE